MKPKKNYKKTKAPETKILSFRLPVSLINKINKHKIDAKAVFLDAIEEVLSS